MQVSLLWVTVLVAAAWVAIGYVISTSVRKVDRALARRSGTEGAGLRTTDPLEEAFMIFLWPLFLGLALLGLCFILLSEIYAFLKWI